MHESCISFGPAPGEVYLSGAFRTVWTVALLSIISFQLGESIPAEGSSLSNCPSSTPRVGLYHHVFLIRLINRYGFCSACSSACIHCDDLVLQNQC